MRADDMTWPSASGTPTAAVVYDLDLGVEVERIVGLIEAVESAILDEGPNPRYHREVMARHRREWPTLWVAIDALLEGYA